MRLLLTADPEIEVPPRLYGGIERIVDVLVRRLQTAGHQVGLVAKAGSSCPADAFFPWPGERSQSKPDTLSNSLGAVEGQCAISGPISCTASRASPICCRTCADRCRWSCRSSAIRRRAPSGSRRSSRRPAVLTFTGCSEYIARIGRPSGGEWLGIHNFADTEALHFSPAVPADAPLVLPEPGRAASRARTGRSRSRAAPAQRLVIAGNHSDTGPEGDYWREKIVPEIGRDGIEYVGPVDDAQKDKLLGGAKAMIVPIQWNEPFGIVFAESLACGTPVISCPTGALPEIVRPGIEGFLIESIEEGCEAVAKDRHHRPRRLPPARGRAFLRRCGGGALPRALYAPGRGAWPAR